MPPRLPFVVILGVVLAATPIAAHPLNVYVQAAQIDVEPTGVRLELRLTPGVNVAPQILAGIDANGDNVISGAEQTAYAEAVRRELSLAMDGHPLALRLISSSFAPVDRMRRGLGEISLTFQAEAPHGDGLHHVTFENRHERAIAAYLVNTLEPSDPAVRIVSQNRAYDQSTYRLDFALGAAPTTQPDASRGGLRAWLNRTAALPVIAAFVGHGVHHILTGYDHLLFLGALVLAAVTLWDLIKVVTAFTVAHSLTLTLAALNVIHAPDRLVEPIIAGSIVFVAVQNVWWPKRARGRSRLIAAFLFGLFHGLGFAGGLLDVMHQMQTGTVLLAIVGFSLGVEIGNQIVLLPLFGAMQVVRRLQAHTPSRPRLSAALQRFGSATISVAGLYYLGIALAGLA